jgi:hypothetical protein
MKFSEFTLLQKTSPRKGRFAETWEMQCSCGKISSREIHNVIYGRIKSCGCKRNSLISQSLTIDKNGNKREDYPEYSIWVGMKKRCSEDYSSCPKNRNYTLKNITICERWLNSFENFLSDMGQRPSCDYSIDRIDNSKGYSPENCRWATTQEQARNRDSCVLIEINGKKQILTQWLNELGIKRGQFYRKLKKLKDKKRHPLILYSRE